MKQFLITSSLFVIGTIVLTLVMVVVSSKLVDRGDFYQLPLESRYLIMGHSHPECAFNDSLIGGFENFASSGSNYFYTYFKIKKLIERNPQIKGVFLNYSYVDIDPAMEAKIWDDKALNHRYHKYAPLMDFKDHQLIMKSNLAGITKAQSMALKQNAAFLFRSKQTHMEFFRWGGFNALNFSKADSLQREAEALPQERPPFDIQVAKSNLIYLLKTIDLLAEKNVPLFLMRAPVHKSFHGRKYDSFVEDFMAMNFPNTPFLDFQDFPLNNDEFGDLGHLNQHGANRFSLFFNALIEKGLTVDPTPQLMVRKELAVQDILHQLRFPANLASNTKYRRCRM